MKKRILSILFSALCLALAVSGVSAMKLEGETINGIKAGTIKAKDLKNDRIVTSIVAIKKDEIAAYPKDREIQIYGEDCSGNKKFKGLILRTKYDSERKNVAQFFIDAFMKIKDSDDKGTQGVFKDRFFTSWLLIGLEKLELEKEIYEEMKNGLLENREYSCEDTSGLYGEKRYLNSEGKSYSGIYERKIRRIDEQLLQVNAELNKRRAAL